jgi:hypothetical protein
MNIKFVNFKLEYFVIYFGIFAIIVITIIAEVKIDLV